MSTTLYLPYIGTLQRIALSLVALMTCGSCNSARSPGNTSDGSPGPDIASTPTTEVADAAMLSSPRCCSEVVQLTTVGPDTPCTFTMPESPQDQDSVAFYLNKNIVSQANVDGGSGYSWDPRTLTVVFTGASCATIMSNPQDNVVQMVCGCVSVGPCSADAEICPAP